jgi:hypothetical protein
MLVRIALLILAAVSISSCARTVWDKAGASQQDYNVDSYACEKDARQSGYFGSGIIGGVNMQNFFNRCMVSKGWYQRRASR